MTALVSVSSHNYYWLPELLPTNRYWVLPGKASILKFWIQHIKQKENIDTTKARKTMPSIHATSLLLASRIVLGTTHGNVTCKKPTLGRNAQRWAKYYNHRLDEFTFVMYQRFMKRTCRIQNPDIPRAGRVGAPGGAAGRGRARLGANRIIRPGNKSPPFPPRHRRNVASTSLQKHELMNFKKWFDVPVLEVELTRMPNLKQALKG